MVEPLQQGQCDSLHEPMCVEYKFVRVASSVANVVVHRRRSVEALPKMDLCVEKDELAAGRLLDVTYDPLGAWEGALPSGYGNEASR